jgi:hypothetical protein
MKKEPLATFEEFEQRTVGLLREREEGRTRRLGYFSPVLFRGHRSASCSWKLETTLERYTGNKLYSLEDYYAAVSRAKPTVESCTGRRWDDLPAYSRELEMANQRGAPQGYEFMAYLRHHRFPSPLLDWTRSPYVAAFFAFQDPEADGHEVAIYSFAEFCGNCKNQAGGEADIVVAGPYVATHDRHFRQQSQYTVCRKLSGGRYVYCSHEEAFARGNEEQDRLTKFILPRTERVKVFDRLRIMNITAYSLFGSEESLLEDVALQEI